tara:strand:+ start:15440 stop:16090 length:651 start_codon:yes stop_codon:yes gene_type:complete
MTKLEINQGGEKQVYHLPLSWGEVSIKQYQELMMLIDNEKNELDTKIRTISILTGCELSLLSKASVANLNKVYKKLGELTAKLPSKTFRRVIEIEDVEYGFIPDMNDLTFGEFVDIDTWLQSGYANLIDILTVLYRPVLKRKGERYNIAEYEASSRVERAKVFSRSMSVDSVYGAMVFFYTIASKHIETTLYSLEMQKKKRSSTEQREKKKTVKAP